MSAVHAVAAAAAAAAAALCNGVGRNDAGLRQHLVRDVGHYITSW